MSKEIPLDLMQALGMAPSTGIVMRRPRSRRVTIAIDPGTSGGFAIQYPDGKIDLQRMPDTDADIFDILSGARSSAISEDAELLAVMEKVGGFVARRGTDGGGQPGSRMFNFGEGVGFLRGVVIGLGIPLRMVRPQDWQKGLCLGAAPDKKARKRALQAKARELFPQLTPTLATCDALLILDWEARHQ